MPLLVRSLLRRWPLTLVVLLAACSLAYGATRVVPPQYQDKATVTLIPPRSVENPGANRYLLLGGMTPARDILIRSLTSDQVKTEVTAGVPETSYEISPDYTTSAPFMMLLVIGPTPESADLVMQRVLARVPQTLESLQDELDTKQQARINALVISSDEKPKRAGKKQIRAVIAAGGGSTVVGVLAIAVIDNLLLARRRRREAAAAPVLNPDPETPQGAHVKKGTVPRSASETRLRTQVPHQPRKQPTSYRLPIKRPGRSARR